MRDMVVELKDLTVGYGKKVIIDNININAQRGKLICLLGPNGAGKTTILRTLSGHLKPISGQVCINGQEVNSINKKELSKILSIVLTEGIEPGLFTAGDIVAFGRHPHINFFGKLTKEDRKIVEDSMAAVGALDLRHRYYSTLSDGEKQKIMIARALCQRPQVMVLDEPTSHLDVKNRIEVLTILRELTVTTGITAIISLHDVDLALKTSDIVILVGDGRIVDWGTPEKVVDHDTINNLYSINSAGYNHRIGCLELLNTNKQQVFVIAGQGSGVPVYRMLSRLNIGFNGGILDGHDLDAMIATTMGRDYIDAKDGGALTSAEKEILNSNVVICTNDDGYFAKELKDFAISHNIHMLDTDSEIDISQLQSLLGR